jgi:hypothetical protein
MKSYQVINNGGLPELRKNGFFCRFNAADEESIRFACGYVGCTKKETEEIVNKYYW